MLASLNERDEVAMAKTFMNPILEKGPDPWMYKHTDGKYYFMFTLGDHLELWASETLTGIKSADRKIIWWPPSSGPGSKGIWAPEIHNLQGTWYIYFTAGDGTGDKGRRIYVLENQSTDPLQGTWTEKGEVNTQHPGLDGTVFEQNGLLYFLYAGYGSFPDYGSAVYIAAMKNPWTLTGENILLSKPEYDWEKQGGMAINEGPVILKRKDRIFLIYRPARHGRKIIRWVCYPPQRIVSCYVQIRGISPRCRYLKNPLKTVSSHQDITAL